MSPTLRQHFIDFIRTAGMNESPKDFALLITDLCTEREVQIIVERWTIAKLLHMGFPYREIGRKTGASASTISKIAKKLEGKATLQTAFNRRQEYIEGLCSGAE